MMTMAAVVRAMAKKITINSHLIAAVEEAVMTAAAEAADNDDEQDDRRWAMDGDNN